VAHASRRLHASAPTGRRGLITIRARSSRGVFALAQNGSRPTDSRPRRTVTPSGPCQGSSRASKCGYALYRTSTDKRPQDHYYRPRLRRSRHLASLFVTSCAQDFSTGRVDGNRRCSKIPQLLQCEIDRRLAAARSRPDQTARGGSPPRARSIRRSIDRLLKPIRKRASVADELRERMPNLRRRNKRQAECKRSSINQPTANHYAAKR